MRWQITEKSIAAIWQQKLIRHLVTDNGQEVEVIYPGKRNASGGPDFIGAVFLVDGRIVEGGVELHVASSDWYSHGHDRNSKSEGVVLHVVWYYDTYQQARLRNGSSIPTAALSACFGSIARWLSSGGQVLVAGLPGCPYSNRVPVLGVITLMGEARFLAKANLMKSMLTRGGATQLLIRYICRSLGYAQNCTPFEKLADGLPGEIADNHIGALQRRALLFGLAGLLPSQRVGRCGAACDDSEVKEMEAIWTSTGIQCILGEKEWCFFRVRPDNFPPRRIAALSELLSRYGEPGLLDGILSLLRQSPCGSERSWLERGLTVSGGGYWGNHIDFGVAKSSNSALLGRERAAEITVSVILPFAFAWGWMSGEPHLSERAFGIFRSYGKISENEITRYMRQQLGIYQELELSTSQHQGLVHLFKAYCNHRQCASCPLANPTGG